MHRPRGRAPGGGKTPGSGRGPGTQNRVTKHVREAIAGKPLEVAVAELVALAQSAEDERVRLSAASLLVRCAGGDVGGHVASALVALVAQAPRTAGRPSNSSRGGQTGAGGYLDTPEAGRPS